MLWVCIAWLLLISLPQIIARPSRAKQPGDGDFDHGVTQTIQGFVADGASRRS
jgi:hypothetical protein